MSSNDSSVSQLHNVVWPDSVLVSPDGVYSNVLRAGSGSAPMAAKLTANTYAAITSGGDMAVRNA